MFEQLFEMTTVDGIANGSGGGSQVHLNSTRDDIYLCSSGRSQPIPGQTNKRVSKSNTKASQVQEWRITIVGADTGTLMLTWSTIQ